MAKETIYIDADEEITSIIDKVLQSPQKVVAIVVPKRAIVFQSAVNMKLLKKSATENKKSIVVITSDPAIENIAAISAVHVARSLTSKPELIKKEFLMAETTISSKELYPDEKGSAEGEDAQSQDDTPTDDEPIELDNTLVAMPDTGSSATETKKKSKFKIPDFSSFKIKMTLFLTVITLVIVGWIYAFKIMPKATVTIDVSTDSVDVGLDFTASTKVTELNKEKLIVPATKAEVTKENKATVPATGEKDEGEKATGKITLTNCAMEGVTIPVGTEFTAGDITFVSTEAVAIGPGVIIGTCRSAEFPAFGAVKEVAVVASESGTKYNVGASDYSTGIADLTATGTAMSGGTSKIVKVVSKEDIKNATDQLKGSSSSDASSDLKTELEDKQLFALVETLKEVKSTVKPSVAVGAKASEVTVTSSVKYQMLGVKEQLLSQLIEEKIKLELSGQQNIRNNGLDTAAIRVTVRSSDDVQKLSLQSVAIIGPEFDIATIQKDIAGKKRGEIESMLNNRDGVADVTVEYAPFWVFETPKSASKITVVINESKQ